MSECAIHEAELSELQRQREVLEKALRELALDAATYAEGAGEPEFRQFLGLEARAHEALRSIGKHVRDAAPAAPKEPRP